MIIQYMSDIHLEFGNIDKIKIVGDIIILAGDIDVSFEHIINFIKRFKKTPVIYVPGNHEFYAEEIYTDERMEHLKHEFLYSFGERCHILNRDVVTIDGINFVGAIGWTNGSWKKWEPWMSGVNDLNYIKGFKKANGGQDWGKRDYKFLKDNVNENSIVVTHYAPLSKSCRPEWLNGPLDVFFNNDWSELIFTKKPKIWIHGHTHDSYNYVYGHGTRILCNPRGYYDYEMNKNFNPHLIIEIK